MTNPHTITDEQALLLALHAIHVQGGFSTPEIERERAAKDIAQGCTINWARIQAEVDTALMSRSSAPAHSATAPANDTPKLPPVEVVPEPGSRLDQLLASYPDAKAAADAATERLKGITDGIKAELGGVAGDRGAVAKGHGVALGLTYVERWTVDTKRMKAENPALYVEYARRGGSWRLAPLGAKGES